MKATVSALPVLWLALAACQPSGEQGGEAERQEAQPPAEQPSQQPPAAGREQPSAGSRAGESTPGTAPGAAGIAAETAEAEILATEGQDTGGVIRFTRTADGVRIQGTVSGLAAGEHGFHIHAKGDCSAPDGSSAGDHFNPQGHPHGAPDDPPDQRHAGDLGNITADESGEAEVNLSVPGLAMSGPDSIIGKAVIVHAQRDDLESQPSGNAGARVGCGVIQPVDVTGPDTAP